MAESIEGGIYKDASGDGYHDANGKPVPASKAAEANKVKQPTSVIAVPLPTPIEPQRPIASVAKPKG